ncbi:unnamed protein product [Dovyalis caffra]|uniref:Carbamoyl phosphate synthase preATP-grasp domain-containing protein n=1 Tax=Dovyalis caffra TaxID=77055 RepID=A0AAV1SR68_9ROSI|nr:unnamed protein product [Dovyalis caffra]
MIDPDMADHSYVTPMMPEVNEQAVAKERLDAILPTMDGQTTLNLVLALAKNGVSEKYDVELIGAKLHAIKKVEDRDLFTQDMENIGLETLPSGVGRK